MVGSGALLGIPYPALFAPQFPPWVVRKIGEPILVDADFNQAAFPNSKYGLFATSTGTIARDTTVNWGGLGSVKHTTAAAANDNVECKLQIQDFMRAGEFVSFEAKWCHNNVSASAQQFIGIESRPNAGNVLQSKFQWIKNNLEWKYESASSVYTSFPASIGGPTSTRDTKLDAVAGTPYGWARVVIDPVNRLYVGFECAGVNGIQTRDMRSLAIPLIDNGSATNGDVLLFFTQNSAGAASVDILYTMDWCVSRIPAGVNPF